MRTFAKDRLIIPAALVLLAALLWPATAGAADGRIPIRPEEPSSPGGDVPTVFILESGSYYLTCDIFKTTGVAIQILADDVTLDLDGHTVSVQDTTSGSDLIRCWNWNDVRVTNGLLQGGYNGVDFVGGGLFFQADHLRVSGAGYAGIFILGTDARHAHGVVARNRVYETGTRAGIYLQNVDGGRVEDNVVLHTTSGDGIWLYTSHRNTVTGNTCSGDYYSGIRLYQSNGNTVSWNNCSNHPSWCGIFVMNSIDNTVDWNDLGNNNTGLYIVNSVSLTYYGNVYSFNHAPHAAGYTGFLISPGPPGVPPYAADNGGGNYE